jgi:hypothetical protein
MKSLITRPFVVATILFLIVNLLFAHQFKQRSAVEVLRERDGNVPMAKTFTGWTARRYAKLDQAPDVVLFGSSQMGTAVFSTDADKLNKGIDCVKHRHCVTLQDDLEERLGQPVKVFNWSLGGSMVSDAYLESLAMFDGDHKPRMVVLGVNPRDFIDNSLTNAGSTEQFHFFTRYVDPGNLAKVAIPSTMGRFEWAFNRVIPLRRLGMDVQGTYLANNLEEDADDSSAKKGTQPLQAVSVTGKIVKENQWVVPAHIPADVFVDNTKEYKARYANPYPKLYKAEMRFFKEFLALMKQKDIEVLVVGMPSLWPNRTLLPPAFWADWRNQVSVACKDQGVTWMDLTDSPKFQSGDYLDMVHYNAQGGAKFFNLIADYIVSNKRMVACLKHGQSLAQRSSAVTR